MDFTAPVLESEYVEAAEQGLPLKEGGDMMLLPLPPPGSDARMRSLQRSNTLMVDHIAQHHEEAEPRSSVHDMHVSLLGRDDQRQQGLAGWLACPPHACVETTPTCMSVWLKV
jgi:hypothetical protein